MSSEQSIDELSDPRGIASVEIRREEFPGVGALDPVLRLMGGASGEEKEALLIPSRCSSVRLRDVRADGVGGADKLNSDRPLVQRRPRLDLLPKLVSETDSELVSEQVLVATHDPMSARNGPSLPRVASGEWRVAKGAP